jgi:hypothetical protein
VDERLGTEAAASKRESHQQSSLYSVICLLCTLQLLVAENWHRVFHALLWYRDQGITLLSAVKPTNYLGPYHIVWHLLHWQAGILVHRESVVFGRARL